MTAVLRPGGIVSLDGLTPTPALLTGHPHAGEVPGSLVLGDGWGNGEVCARPQDPAAWLEELEDAARVARAVYLAALGRLA